MNNYEALAISKPHIKLVPTNSNPPSSNALVRFLEYLKDLLSFSKDLNDLHKPNESTMEKKVEEEVKNVPKKIKMVLHKVSPAPARSMSLS